jgi:branched-chain amino acid transport system ATP-binding protein
MTVPVLEVRGLCVAYGRAMALHGVDLEVHPGEVVALLGANGAGKTTTLRAISGLMKPADGDIRFQGQPIGGLPAEQVLKRGIAHCPEERHIWPAMNVEENLSLGAYTCRSRADVVRRMAAVLELFPRLAERRRQYAGTLSGGEQQMVALGRALMSEPRLLLLDEPSLGLSPRISQFVMQVIRDLRDKGVGVLLVEQNVHQALGVASRGYVLGTGRVVAQNQAAALLGDSRLMQAYLGG